MLDALSDPILPIFAVLAVGFLLRKTGTFNAVHAATINRFVFYLSAPALVFIVVATAPLDEFHWPALMGYLAAEVISYAAIAMVARKVFKRHIGEALLLGMAASFSNHVFFVRPIAVLTYGEAAVFPIAGIVVFDALIFCVTVFLMDILVAQRGNPAQAAATLIRNPFVYAPSLAVAAWWFGDLTPSGFLTFARFAGASAAPASLFALGIVLAGTSLIRFGPLLWIVVGTNLLIFPTLVFLGHSFLGVDGPWTTLLLLVAAGPCGTMPFVIATQYDVNTDTIAKAILISTTLSVFSLSLLL